MESKQVFVDTMGNGNAFPMGRKGNKNPPQNVHEGKMIKVFFNCF